MPQQMTEHLRERERAFMLLELEPEYRPSPQRLEGLPYWVSPWLSCYSVTLSRRRASEYAQISYATAERWLADVRFATLVRECWAATVDMMEREAVRRAVHGEKELQVDRNGNVIFIWTDLSGNPIPEPEYPDNEPLWMVVDRNGRMHEVFFLPVTRKPFEKTKKSDPLMQFLLKGLKRGTYGDKVELDHSVNYSEAEMEQRERALGIPYEPFKLPGDSRSSETVIEFDEPPACECGKPQAYNEKAGRYCGCCDECMPF